MDSSQIRKAQMSDAELIAQFNVAMARETESRLLSFDTVHAGVQHLIAHPELGFYLVADCEETPVACLLITFEWSDWRNGLFWWIQSVYVKPEFRRLGIYRALYRHLGFLAGQSGGVCGFRLYVEKDNTAAQAVYESLGMSRTDYLLYETCT